MPRDPLTSTRSPARSHDTISRRRVALGRRPGRPRQAACPRATAASASACAASPPTRDQAIESSRGRGAAALLVQRAASARRAPASRRAPPPCAPRASRVPSTAERLRRARSGWSCTSRRRRDAASRVEDGAAVRRRLQLRRALGDLVERHAELDAPPRWPRARSPGCRGRAAESASRRPPLGVRSTQPRAVEPEILDRWRRGRRPRALSPNSRRGRRSRRRARMTSGSSALQRARRSADAPLENLGLGVGNRVLRREVAECASPTLVHTRTSGSAIPTSSRISPAWFMPSSITATSAPCRSSSSDSGSPRWLFRLPLFFTTSIAAGEKRRNRFLRRRLAGAAGDGDHRCAGLAPDELPEVLQRRGRVGDLDDDRHRTASLAPIASFADVSTARPRPRRRARTHRPRTRGRRARRRSRRTDRPARSVRESIANAVDRRGPASPTTQLPPVAVAIIAAVSRPFATALTQLAFAGRLRRRASAARATSPSSNGSTRSPIC